MCHSTNWRILTYAYSCFGKEALKNLRQHDFISVLGRNSVTPLRDVIEYVLICLSWPTYLKFAIFAVTPLRVWTDVTIHKMVKLQSHNYIKYCINTLLSNSSSSYTRDLRRFSKRELSNIHT